MTESNKLEERIQNRRLRRWKRRGRIIAPFAAIPLLLATLMLSVGIVEYAPQEPRMETVVKRVPTRTHSIRPSLATQTAIATPSVADNVLLDDDGPIVDALALPHPNRPTKP
jgi:hypothetical protein